VGDRHIERAIPAGEVDCDESRLFDHADSGGAGGHWLVFRFIGVTPGYVRLMGAMIVFFGGIWWLGRRSKKKIGSANTQ
jgi:hypothetical protein